MLFCSDITLAYCNKFNCTVATDQFGYYGCIYQKKPTLEDIMNPNRSVDIIAYDVNFLSLEKREELMKKSIETGKDLLFELCKDKKVIITKKMQYEAWEKG